MLQAPDLNGPAPDLLLEGVNTVGNRSKAIYTANQYQTLDLFFSDANAVGLDVLIYDADGFIEVTIYGSSNLPLDTVDVLANRAGKFFGVVSDAGHITRINLSSQSPSGPYEGVDNIAFGRIPEPASLFLVGLGLAGLGVIRKRATSLEPHSSERNLF